MLLLNLMHLQSLYLLSNLKLVILLLDHRLSTSLALLMLSLSQNRQLTFLEGMNNKNFMNLFMFIKLLHGYMM